MATGATAAHLGELEGDLVHCPRAVLGTTVPAAISLAGQPRPSATNRSQGDLLPLKPDDTPIGPPAVVGQTCLTLIAAPPGRRSR